MDLWAHHHRVSSPSHRPQSCGRDGPRTGPLPASSTPSIHSPGTGGVSLPLPLRRVDASGRGKGSTEWNVNESIRGTLGRTEGGGTSGAERDSSSSTSISSCGADFLDMVGGGGGEEEGGRKAGAQKRLKTFGRGLVPVGPDPLFAPFSTPTPTRNQRQNDSRTRPAPCQR